MAKRKKTVLPRVTVLAYNRRDLATFAQAVEKLGLLVEDLRHILERRAGKVKAPGIPTPPSATT